MDERTARTRREPASSGQRPRTRRGSGSEAQAKRHVGALDGIRALAIVGVLLYHAFPGWLPGGFLGVTIFFTLSGYLITGGIVDELDRRGTFRLMHFYAKRLRRLWPLMAVVVVAVAILTAIFATSLLQKMQPDAVPALLFFDNIWYIVQDLSYFAAAGQPSPLTHFWYLGLIGQFYLVWPLLIWLVWKVLPSRTAVRRFAAILMVVSLVLMIWMYDPAGDPSRVYYGTDTRFAELMVGAWMALAFPIKGSSPLSRKVGRTALGNARVTDIIGVVVLAALIAMMFIVTGSTSLLYYGGYLFTGILTCLLLLAVLNTDSILGKVLALKPFSYISTRSYGLYLWHYPLLLIMNPATRTTALPWWGWVIEFLVIFGVTELTYRFVEQKTGSGQIGEFFGRLRSGELTFGRMDMRGKLLTGIIGIAALATVVLVACGPFWDNDLKEEEQRTTVLYKVQHTDYVSQIKNEIAARQNLASVPEGACPYGVFIICDSVALDAETDFYERFPNGYMDGRIGRWTGEAFDVWNAEVANGRNPEVVVFSLGSNGPLDDDIVKQVIELAGNRPVFWVNNRMPDDFMYANNEVLARVCDQYPNATLVDWFGESAGHDEWFWNDGEHIRPEGCEAFMEMLKRYIMTNYTPSTPSAGTATQ